MLTIPEIAAAEVEKAILEEEMENSRSIFLAGSKSVGKTTAIHSFLDKTDPVRESLVLEYSFGRKSKQKQGGEKLICHVWEYGGKLELLKEVISSVPKQGHLAVVIMLDLSKPKRLWSTLEMCLEAVDGIATGGNDYSSAIALLFVGGKYDLFKNFDSEVKRNICITIRSVALIFRANLLFYAHEEASLVKRIKQSLLFYGFNNACFPKEKYINHNKALCIPQGSDSWESLGVAESTMEQVKQRHLALFPMELGDLAHSTAGGGVSDEAAATGASAAWSHSEPILYSIRTKKYDEMLDVIDIATVDYLKML